MRSKTFSRTFPLFAFLFILLQTKSFLPTSVFAKSYNIGQVLIEATVNKDGSMSVVEERVYNFDGSFTFAYQTINKSIDPTKNTGRTESYQIEDLRVCDQVGCYQELTDLGRVHRDYRSIGNQARETFFLIDENRQYYIKWFYSANNEQKRFQLSYLVPNAVTFQEDVAEVYWQFVGDEWDRSQGPISVKVNLPEGTNLEQTQAWLHGPLDGQVSIAEEPEIFFEVGKLQPGTYFEGRVTLPLDVFTAQAIDEGAQGSLTLEDIKQQEQGFIRQTQRLVYRSWAILIIVIV
ncbi:DUF2207 domain-containing protein, partial [Candidatus Micrarchaeota archaeon]|nr:DUF2207 domain-containing protein [Candidatus Micrarchaeota archaeon]